MLLQVFDDRLSLESYPHRHCGALLRRTAEGGCPHVVLSWAESRTRPSTSFDSYRPAIAGS